MNVENISFEKLLQRYQAVVAENCRLKEENQALKAQLGTGKLPVPTTVSADHWPEAAGVGTRGEDSIPNPAVSNTSDVIEKIDLFMSLFKGRDDVYPLIRI